MTKRSSGRGVGGSRVVALDGQGRVAGSDGCAEVIDFVAARAMLRVHPAYAGMSETDYTSRLCMEILSLPTAAKASLGYTVQGLLGGARAGILDV